MPGKLGAWNKVCAASEIWMSAGQSAVRSALRKILPITQACSQVKCAKVKLFSSRERSLSCRLGARSVLSMALDDIFSGGDTDEQEGCWRCEGTGDM